MSSIAEKILETVNALPDSQAEEVLDFAQYLQAKTRRQQENAFSSEDDFYTYAGIWQGRDIDQKSLRALAWRETQA